MGDPASGPLVAVLGERGSERETRTRENFVRVNTRRAREGRRLLTRWTILSSVLALALITLTLLTTLSAFADVQGPNYAGTGVDGNEGGAIWAKPINATGSSTTTAAEVILNSTNQNSNTLRLTNYGFSIPTGSTIDGIVVSIYRGTLAVTDSRISLIVGGALTSTNKADTVTEWPNAAAAVSYGSATDLWGQTLTVADINASNFGIAISAKSVNNGTKRPDVYYVNSPLS